MECSGPLVRVSIVFSSLLKTIEIKVELLFSRQDITFLLWLVKSTTVNIPVVLVSSENANSFFDWLWAMLLIPFPLFTNIDINIHINIFKFTIIFIIKYTYWVGWDKWLMFSIYVINNYIVSSRIYHFVIFYMLKYILFKFTFITQNKL